MDRGPYPPQVALAPQTPANQQSASGVGGFIPYGAVSTRTATASFVPIVLDVQMYGRISDPGMRPSPLRVGLDPQVPGDEQRASGVEVSTSCGAVSTREAVSFVLGLVKLQMY